MEIRFMAIGNEKRTEEREMGEEEQISLSLLSTVCPPLPPRPPR